jgi:predicted dehydrogenase
VKIAIVGCGYVADYYLRTLPNHGNLTLAGVWDANAEALNRFARYWSVRPYRDLHDLLHDHEIKLVVNLTNPGSHYTVTQASLSAGKHVYSEKPLSTNLEEAKALVELAAQKNLYLSSAPCNLLGGCAQTIWHALRRNAIGDVRLVYAQLDDGMIHRGNYRSWCSESGSPWPWKDEFETGCVLEHAGYYVTWLVAFFGPATALTACGSVVIPDKRTDVPLESPAPDFVVANIRFESGVVARLTCSIVAPVDRSLLIVGEKGELSVDDCWDYGAQVYIQRESFPRWRRKYPRVRKARIKKRCGGPHNMDFARGVADLAESITGGYSCHLPADFSLHVNEIVLAMRYPQQTQYPYMMTTSCDSVRPMPWAT